MPLTTPWLARDYFGTGGHGRRCLRRRDGVSSLGTWRWGRSGAGGGLRHLGSYAWLYVASGLLAAGAVAVSLAFPPVAGPERRQPAVA